MQQILPLWLLNCCLMLKKKFKKNVWQAIRVSLQVLAKRLGIMRDNEKDMWVVCGSLTTHKKLRTWGVSIQRSNACTNTDSSGNIIGLYLQHYYFFLKITLPTYIWPCREGHRGLAYSYVECLHLTLSNLVEREEQQRVQNRQQASSI